jgi:hypothetical protein
MPHVLNLDVCGRSMGQIRTLIALPPAKEPALCVRCEGGCSDPRVVLDGLAKRYVVCRCDELFSICCIMDLSLKVTHYSISGNCRNGRAFSAFG